MAGRRLNEVYLLLSANISPPLFISFLISVDLVYFVVVGVM